MPIDGKRLSENQMRDSQYFRQPGKHDNNGEASGFNPQDGAPPFLGLFHDLTVLSFNRLVQRRLNLPFSTPTRLPGCLFLRCREEFPAEIFGGDCVNCRVFDTETSLAESWKRVRLVCRTKRVLGM